MTDTGKRVLIVAGMIVVAVLLYLYLIESPPAYVLHQHDHDHDHDHPHDHPVDISLEQNWANTRADLMAQQEWLNKLDRRIVQCEMEAEDAHMRITEWHPDK